MATAVTSAILTGFTLTWMRLDRLGYEERSDIDDFFEIA